MSLEKILGSYREPSVTGVSPECGRYPGSTEGVLCVSQWAHTC